MIVSHKYKFIFIKTSKTAGTSIEIALSRFCGKKDIITKISKSDENIRRGLGYPGPQNYFIPLYRYKIRDWARLLIRGKRIKFMNHMSAEEIKRLVGKKTWNSYYKFCFERNPYDRVISMYYWFFGRNQKKIKPLLTLSDFLETKVPLNYKRKGIGLYTIEGKVVADQICKFENLKEELEEIRLHLGIPDKLELPNAKSGFRKDKRHYRDVLTDKERAKIAEIFAEEIELFDYEF